MNSLFWPIAISMILQNSMGFIDAAILSFYDTFAVNSVSIASQIQSIFGPMYFGIASGIGIYTAQAVGAKDKVRLKQVFSIGILMSIAVGIISMLVSYFFNNEIISFYVDPSTDIGKMSLDYFNGTIISKPFLAFNLFFTFQFRTIQKPKIPLVTNSLSLILNSILNVLLIFGFGPIPSMGIMGAAIATNISVILLSVANVIVSLYLKAEFLGSYKLLKSIKFSFILEILQKVYPLMLVELLFGLSRVFYTKLYVQTGDVQFAIEQITSKLALITNSFVMATAFASGILMGEILGEGDPEKLEESQSQVMKFIRKKATFVLLVTTFVLPFGLLVFNVEREVLIYCIFLLFINGVYMFMRTYSSSLLSIIKSGGDTKFTIIADPAVSYLIGLPLSYIALKYFGADLYVLKMIWLVDIFGKFVITFWRYKTGIWKKKVV